MRRDDQIAFLDREVVHRHDRQVATERLPARAVVEGHPDAPFRAREEQPAPHRVLAHDPHELGGGDSVHDLGPGVPVIGGLPDVGRHVLELIAIRGDVGGARRVV